MREEHEEGGVTPQADVDALFTSAQDGINESGREFRRLGRGQQLQWIFIGLLGLLCAAAIFLAIEASNSKTDEALKNSFDAGQKATLARVRANEAKLRALSTDKKQIRLVKCLTAATPKKLQDCLGVQPGAPGQPGAAGVPGSPGRPGKSTQGLQGLAGAPGPTGPPGPEGPKGDVGQAGVDGKDGAAGLNGEPGPKGDTGAAGADGAKGADGATGPPGPQGDPGPQGAQGPPGADGPPGPAGPPGPTCPAGFTGSNLTVVNSNQGLTDIFACVADPPPAN